MTISFSISDEQRDLAALATSSPSGCGRLRGPLTRRTSSRSSPWCTRRPSCSTSYMIPAAYGGGGIESLVTDCLIVEELSWGDDGLGALVTSGGCLSADSQIGSEEQKARRPGSLCGERPPRHCAAHTTEPDHGSDAAGMTTLATRIDGGYRLRGQKTWVSPVA